MNHHYRNSITVVCLCKLETFVLHWQRAFYACVQPMRDDITLYSHLSLAGCIHKMIPALELKSIVSFWINVFTFNFWIFILDLSHRTKLKWKFIVCLKYLQINHSYFMSLNDLHIQKIIWGGISLTCTISTHWSLLRPYHSSWSTGSGLKFLTLKGPIPYIYGTQVWLSLCLQMS